VVRAIRHAGDVFSPGRRAAYGDATVADVRRALDKRPRDGLGFEGNRSMRQRMIRRGMPYGPPLPDGVDDVGEARGLVFVTFQASIARQFEGVQTPWLSDGNIFGLGADRDFLLGDPSSSNTGKMTIQGERPFFLAPPRAFVVMRGGEYLFVPSVTALRAISQNMAR